MTADKARDVVAQRKNNAVRSVDDARVESSDLRTKRRRPDRDGSASDGGEGMIRMDCWIGGAPSLHAGIISRAYWGFGMARTLTLATAADLFEQVVIEPWISVTCSCRHVIGRFA